MKKLSGKEYIAQKRKQVLKAPDAWRFSSKTIDDKEAKRLRKTLTHLNASENYIDQLIQAKYDDRPIDPETQFRLTLEVFSDSLKDDLNVYTSDKYASIVSKLGLSVIECGRVHAGCRSVDDFHDPLDGHAVQIGIGTYFATQLLAKNIIVENFTNDFEQYKTSTDQFLDQVADIYINQDREATKGIKFDEYPIDVEAEASAAQSAVSVKLMQFIALHELAHIVNDDRDIMSFNHVELDENNPTNTDSTPDKHEKEFRADMFALSYLIEDLEDLNRWSTFYPIYYYLVWTNAVEKKFNVNVSFTHPDSLVRANRLRERVSELTGEDDFGYNDYLDTCLTRFDTWMNK